VSMRNTWGAYLVNSNTGAIEWTLGGKHSSFEFKPGADFQWQHDVVLQPNSTVTLFDDHCCQLTGGGSAVPASGLSRGLVLRLDQHARTATLVAQYIRSNDRGYDPQYMGDTQPVAKGNVFVGWGNEPYLSEFNAAGKLLFEGEFPRPDLTYRATLEQWVGFPSSPPAGAARVGDDGRTTVYASWNGATQLTAWRVLASAGGGALRTVAKASRSGFETAIELNGRYTSFKLQALDANGRVIGTSHTFSAQASQA